LAGIELITEELVEYIHSLAKMSEELVEYVHSLAGIELISEELVEVTVLTDGGPVRPHMSMFRTASVWLTQADGSIGRTGSCRGIVK